MEFNFRTRGVCSQVIHFELDNEHKVHNTYFIGGCNGNLKGLSQLVEGMKAEDVISRLEGTLCNNKRTSCPDQLAQALKAAIAQQ